MMIEILLATAINCSDSKELVENIMKKSTETVLYKHELIEVIKRLGFKLDQTLSKIINQLDEVIELNDDEPRYEVK